jgi:hypothetical protein
MKLLVIGHYGSCNMGDKYQPFAIIDAIFSRTTLFGTWNNTKNIYFLNFSSASENQDMHFTYNDTMHKVYSPNDLINDVFDVAILTTGSMSKESPYVNWIIDYLKRGTIKKLIIWGGFSRGNSPFQTFSDGLSFLNSPNVIYFARSFSDFEIATQIKGNENCYLSGDPMIYYSTTEGKVLSNNLTTNTCIEKNLFSIICKLHKKLVVIPSIYAFKFNRTYWENQCEIADIIVCIDTFSDNSIYEKYEDKTIMINKPHLFFKILNNTDRVISGRLHGALLSANEHVPTTMIITDDALPGTGSFKFDAVGNHSSGLSMPLCDVVTTKQDQQRNPLYIPAIEENNLDIYTTLTLKSLDKLIELMYEDIPISKIKFSDSDETSIYLLSKDKNCTWIPNDFDYKNDLVSHCIFNDFCWEPYQTEVMIEIYKSLTNKLFIDIGSHIGYYSLIASHFGLNVRAFEQNENIFDILSLNLENKSSVELKNELVHQQTTILNENENVGLIKIDVEGGEPEIIDGLQPFISNYKIDSAIVEISPKFRSLSDLHRLIEIFTSCGYKVYDIGLSEERRQLNPNTQHLHNLKTFIPDSLNYIHQTNLLFFSPKAPAALTGIW